MKMAEELGTTASTVARWERGERGISDENALLVKILYELDEMDQKKNP